MPNLHIPWLIHLHSQSLPKVVVNVRLSAHFASTPTSTVMAQQSSHNMEPFVELIAQMIDETLRRTTYQRRTVIYTVSFNKAATKGIELLFTLTLYLYRQLALVTVQSSCVFGRDLNPPTVLLFVQCRCFFCKRIRCSAPRPPVMSTFVPSQCTTHRRMFFMAGGQCLLR